MDLEKCKNCTALNSAMNLANTYAGIISDFINAVDDIMREENPRTQKALEVTLKEAKVLLDWDLML